MTAEEAKKLTKDVIDRSLANDKEQVLLQIATVAQEGRSFTFFTIFKTNKDEMIKYLQDLGYQTRIINPYTDKPSILINW